MPDTLETPSRTVEMRYVGQVHEFVAQEPEQLRGF